MSNCFRVLNQANALVFHPLDMSLFNLPERKRSHYFVMWINESPGHYLGALKYLETNFFNLSMTYRRDSDVPKLYGQFEKIDLSDSEKKLKREEVEDAVAKKSKSALIMVSDCSVDSRREAYLRELTKYMNVSIYGDCNDNTCDLICTLKGYERHRFYLAFENSVCRDYITEKFFRSLNRFIVPITLKRSILAGVAPSDSFIAVDDFKNAKELADHLKWLESNQTAYLRYFDWMQNYRVVEDPPAACKLCEILHRAQPMMIPDIKQWWNGSDVCDNHYAEKFI